MIGGVPQVKTRRMDGRTNPDWSDSIAAALDWWRDAGVDVAFTDEPRAWLRPEEADGSAGSASSATGRPAAAMRAQPPPPPPEPAPEPLPDDLEAFHAWWMSAPVLDHGPLAARVPPRGPARAALMIVIPAPEEEDGDQLLSGPTGRLIDGFLAAAGLPLEAAYRASVMPSYAPASDWAAVAPTLGPALIRHVRLVEPERLLILGSNIPPLFGHSLPQGPAVWDIFNHEGVTVPMLTVRKVAAPASQPRWKSGLWQAWLDGTA